MKKYALLWVAILFTITSMTGCATSGRNYQSDVDSLNARVTALQGQLSAKDQEIAALQSKMNDERLAREASESAMRAAENEKLLAQQNAAKASSKTAVAGSEYLK